MAEKLCPSCQRKGICWFKSYAEAIVGNAVPSEDRDLLFNQAAEINRKIASSREEARGRMCPNLNTIDPDYPGRNLL